MKRSLFSESRDQPRLEELLERARDRIPKDISERSRWTMPQPDIMIEGSQTILRNFSEIVDSMDRDANHVFQYCLTNLVRLVAESNSESC
ncbi:MAG: hypothetical protein Ct9H90mP24_4190 [Methanobacteriota archaeon]|nr:MAG: hypothetical protein Ct9H90mP24_4190 [Euryarchaeota archaeon]